MLEAKLKTTFAAIYEICTQFNFVIVIVFVVTVIVVVVAVVVVVVDATCALMVHIGQTGTAFKLIEHEEVVDNACGWNSDRERDGENDNNGAITITICHSISVAITEKST